jgi:primosomal protein N' (replication factor Y)
MDVDSVRGKQAHDQLIQQFEDHRLDVLVGTQMVVKGLDFDKVELVGILDADSLLSFADFRANERAFQLMEQVSGRAGRKDDTGKVIIQAGNLVHPVLGFVMQHDYASFYAYEMNGRKQFGYPPFSRLIQVTFRHKQKDTVEKAAKAFAGMIHPFLDNALIGPAEPVVNRIRGQYLMEITIKCPRDMKRIEMIKQKLMDAVALFHQEKKYKGTVVIIDVDPA